MSRLTIFITVCLAAGTVQGQSILLVDDTATGANNGSSWCDAYVYLQNALASVSAPSEIRVAQGIYKPDQGVGQTPGDRGATFQLLDGITLTGGYAGCGEADPDTRDVTLYETVLSGDLTGDDGPDFENNDENVYHVVTGSFTDTTAVLDGFTIVGGNAAGPFAAASLLAEVSPQGRASVFADADSRTESGEICGGWSGECDPGKFCKLPVGRCCCDYNGVCTVPPYSCPPAWNPVCGCDGITYANECWADAASMSLNNHGACPNGGGIFNHLGSPTVSDCTFRGNSAYWSGGGMYTY